MIGNTVLATIPICDDVIRVGESEYQTSSGFSAEWGHGLQVYAWSGISLMHAVFYVLAWNTQLPTEIDHIIWKVCTMVVVTLGPLMVHVMDVRLWNSDYDPLADFGVPKKILHRAYTGMIISFALARLCMLVEGLRELLYLPPGSFTVASWSVYLPYFS